MSWNNEEYLPEVPVINRNRPMNRVISRNTSPKQNVRAFAEAIPDGKLSTTNPNTGKKINLVENVERHVLSYLAPRNVKITPVTNTPKKLSTYLNFKDNLAKKMQTKSLMENIRRRQENQAIENANILDERIRRAREHERRMINLNNERNNNNNNNNNNNHRPANPNFIDGGKRKTRKNKKNRRKNKTKANK